MPVSLSAPLDAQKLQRRVRTPSPPSASVPCPACSRLVPQSIDCTCVHGAVAIVRCPFPCLLLSSTSPTTRRGGLSPAVRVAARVARTTPWTLHPCLWATKTARTWTWRSCMPQLLCLRGEVGASSWRQPARCVMLLTLLTPCGDCFPLVVAPLVLPANSVQLHRLQLLQVHQHRVRD